MNYHQKRGSCIVIFLIVFTIDAAIAGPNASSGCAIDLDDATHDYDVNIYSKDIESKGIIGSKDEITIAVVAQNVSDLDTFQVEINYDPDLIQFIRAYENTSQETGFLQQNGGISTGLMVAEKQSGTINIASALIGKDKEEAPDGTGIIAFLDFKILNNTKKIHLSLSNVYYINSDGVKDHITHKQDAFIFASIFIKTSSSKGGKIEPSGIFSVDSGESVNFNIVPDACHRIANVKIDGISQGALTAYSFNNITRNHQIRVRFTPIKEVFRYTPECWKNQFPDIGEDQDDFDKDGYSNLYEYLNDTDPTQADIPGAYMGYQSSLDKNEHLPYHVVFTNPSHPRASQGEAFNIDIMYTSSENDGMDLTNFNLLIHFDSSMLRLSHISNQLTSTTINAINTIESSEHSDNDHFTDKLIDLTFNPGSIQLPARLCTLTYTIVSEDIDNPRLGDISYIGVIIYTDKNCKDNALPVQLNSTFDQTCNLCATFKEIVLPSYSEKQFSKIDQRLTILAPFTISPNVSSKKLKQLCYQWKKTLFNAYPETMYKDIVNVLSLFILNRFRDLSVKEVKEMLNFDLSSTRAGIELIGIGEKKGQKKWQKEGQRNFLIMALKDRFGKLSKQIEIEIRQSNFNTLVKLRKSLFNFSSIDDVYQWWEQYGKPIKKK